MAVFHILKDGTRVECVNGRIVKYTDSPSVYDLLRTIRKEAKT